MQNLTMEEKRQETIKEKPLEAPFFWGFLTWLIPLIGLLLGINLLLTKREETNRNQGYKIVIAGIVGCIGHVGVPIALIAWSKKMGEGYFLGPLSGYLTMYGILVIGMFGTILTPEEMEERLGLTSGHKIRKRSPNKRMGNKQETSDKIICPHPDCKFENEQDSNYCEKCGSELKK
jgi:hypothetical protein